MEPEQEPQLKQVSLGLLSSAEQADLEAASQRTAGAPSVQWVDLSFSVGNPQWGPTG